VEGFEDGTPPFLAAGAIPSALTATAGADRIRLTRHLGVLTARLLEGLVGLCHPNGEPMVRIHGPTGAHERGATVAISLLDALGRVVPYWEVERAARDVARVIEFVAEYG